MISCIACETQVWIEFALRCKYINQENSKNLDNTYDQVIGQLIKMIQEADKWLIW
ncbi:MAG: four helix bundle protein [Deltaproteobacteria bacterium]|nr:four helix bundle protein [Deltaproteobacteria bacterium]